MTALTDQQAREYIESDGSLCPFCNSDNITTVDRDLPYMTVACDKCGEDWQELYQLVGVDDYLKPDPAPDLLAALKDVLREYGKLAYETNQPVKEPAAIQTAREAITKAEA